MKTILCFGTKALFIGLFTVGFVSCNSSRKSTQQQIDGVVKDLPCQKEGRSDAKQFRSYADAINNDLNLARTKAYTKAKANLVLMVNTTIKTVHNAYLNEHQFKDKLEFESKFESLCREVVDHELSNIKIICEEQSVSKEGMFNKFIAIELGKDPILSGIESKIMKNPKLQADYDKMKYHELFDSEMEYLSTKQKQPTD